MRGASSLEVDDEYSRIGAWALGRWRLDELLGSGGMSTVYGAVHRTNGKRVAVKVLHAHLSAMPEGRRSLPRRRRGRQQGRPSWRGLGLRRRHDGRRRPLPRHGPARRRLPRSMARSSRHAAHPRDGPRHRSLARGPRRRPSRRSGPSRRQTPQRLRHHARRREAARLRDRAQLRVDRHADRRHHGHAPRTCRPSKPRAAGKTSMLAPTSSASAPSRSPSSSEMRRARPRPANLCLLSAMSHPLEGRARRAVSTYRPRSPP